MTSQIVRFDPLVWLSGSKERFDLEDKIHFYGLSATVARQDGAILKLLKKARLECLQSKGHKLPHTSTAKQALLCLVFIKNPQQSDMISLILNGELVTLSHTSRSDPWQQGEAMSSDAAMLRN